MFHLTILVLKIMFQHHMVIDSQFAKRSSLAGSMGNLRRDRNSLIGDDLVGNTLFWLLLGQIGSAIFGTISQLRPSNLCSAIGSSVRGAIDSIFSRNQL
jgi:hypothetical protein